MSLFKLSRKKPRRLHTSSLFETPTQLEIQHFQNFPSQALRRDVRVDVFLPPNHFHHPDAAYPVLFLNDGQDVEAIKLAEILEQLYQQKKLPHIIIVAVHANHDRMQEYGIAGQPDYKKRGAKAQAFTAFVIEELIPAVKRRYHCSPKTQDWGYGGFSLGGLSAFDIAWRHPELFSKIGVFSGSFWWRSKAFQPNDPDANRILIDRLQKSDRQPAMKFWLQVGTEDETADRNNNGIIDAIDDTQDVINALMHLGYREGKDIRYVEVIGGQHNLETWAKIMPDFLCWAFG